MIVSADNCSFFIYHISLSTFVISKKNILEKKTAVFCYILIDEGGFSDIYIYTYIMYMSKIILFYWIVIIIYIIIWMTTLPFLILTYFFVFIFQLVFQISSKDCKGNAAAGGDGEHYRHSYDETWNQNRSIQTDIAQGSQLESPNSDVQGSSLPGFSSTLWLTGFSPLQIFKSWNMFDLVLVPLPQLKEQRPHSNQPSSEPQSTKHDKSGLQRDWEGNKKQTSYSHLLLQLRPLAGAGH